MWQLPCPDDATGVALTGPGLSLEIRRPLSEVAIDGLAAPAKAPVF